VFTAHWRQVPHPTILREVVAASRAEGTIESMPALLAPLRDAAVVGLMDTLAAEGHVHDRALLLKLLGDLAADDLDVVVERLDHDRWEHVRDAVAVLQRVGGLRVARLLEKATEHPIPDVRREAVKGLIAAGGTGAVPRLAELSLDPDEHVRSLAVDALGGLVVPEAAAALAGVASRAADHSVRRAALDHLARNPSWAAGQALEGLAGKRSGAPRALRRHAKRALRARKARRT
jgi:HEAT repeat protein